MITHQAFKKLRLNQFFPDIAVVALENWEFMDQLWVGEAIGFSEWLCFEERPTELGLLALDLNGLPDAGCRAVLQALDLPLAKGMSIAEIETVLGQADRTNQFVPDRKSYDFLVTNGEPYHISCTVLNDGGLSYLVVMIAAGRAFNQ